MAHSDARPGTRLTEAERRVVELLAAGLADKQIAAKLGQSPNTVKTHNRRARQRLGLVGTTRVELVEAARERGYLPAVPAAHALAALTDAHVCSVVAACPVCHALAVLWREFGTS